MSDEEKKENSEEGKEERSLVSTSTPFSLPENKRDFDTLKTAMIQGAFVLEMALFNQASIIYDEIVRTDKVLCELDRKLKDIERINKLSPLGQAEVHSYLKKDKNTNLNFLLNLHSSLSDSITHLKDMQKLQEEMRKGGEARVKKDVDRQVNAELRSLILAEIRRRIEEKNKEKEEENEIGG